MKIPKLNMIDISLPKATIDPAYFNGTTISIIEGQNRHGQITNYMVFGIFPDGTITYINYIPRDIYPWLEEPKEVAEGITLHDHDDNTFNIEFRTATSGDMVVEYLGQHILSKNTLVLRDKDGFIKLTRLKARYLPEWLYPSMTRNIIRIKGFRKTGSIPASLANAIQMLLGEFVTVDYDRAIGGDTTMVQTKTIAQLAVMLDAVDNQLAKFKLSGTDYGEMLTTTIRAFAWIQYTDEF